MLRRAGGTDPATKRVVMMSDRIYLDNAATTAVRQEVIDAMTPFLAGDFANPSSMHSSGQRVRRTLEQSRERAAAALGAKAKELIFTGSGTEADNIAIFGLMAAAAPRREFITCATEHHAVLHASDALRKRGFDVNVLPVDREGLVTPDVLRDALSDRTALVSIMHGNNEIGTIQPIAALADAAHAAGALFHSDAVQTVGHIPTNVRALAIDALSFSAHKFDGPKGVGGLFLRDGLRLEPLVYGGGQESGRRSGTENVPGIVGLAVALELAVEELPREQARLTKLRDEFIDRTMRSIAHCYLNGSRTQRLPNNINLRFDGIEGDTLVVGLDLAGIDISTGSACSSGSLEPGHVMTAIGLEPSKARSSIRISLGRTTQASHLERALEVLAPLVARLRALSSALTTSTAESA